MGNKYLVCTKITNGAYGYEPVIGNIYKYIGKYRTTSRDNRIKVLALTPNKNEKDVSMGGGYQIYLKSDFEEVKLKKEDLEIIKLLYDTQI